MNKPNQNKPQPKKSNRFSPEVRERAVRMVHEHRNEYPSQWAAIESIAPSGYYRKPAYRVRDEEIVTLIGCHRKINRCGSIQKGM